MKLVVIAVALAACGNREPAPSGPEPAPKPHSADDTSPVADEAKLGYIGVVTPRATNVVKSIISKAAIEILVQPGAKVKKGEPIAKFDPQSLKQQLKSDTASLRSRQGDLARAYAAARVANVTCQADTKAFKAGVGAGVVMETSCAHVQEANAEITSAKANLDNQSSVIEKLNDTIKNTTVVSPREGHVGLITVHTGDTVEDGKVFMRIDSDEPPIVKFAIPAEEPKRLTAGDHVDIVFDDATKPLDGVVRFVSPDIDPVAQILLAEADMSAPPANLPTGTRCRIRPRTK